MKSMLVRAHLICSDGDCDFTLEFEGTVEEMEALCCDCGYGMAVIGWPDEVPAEAEIVVLGSRPAPSRLRAAA